MTTPTVIGFDGSLTRELGLAPVPDEERHTALGDARWARSIFDAVTKGGDA